MYAAQFGIGRRNDGRLELRLEASMLNGTLYSLRLDGTGDDPDEAKFLGWLRDIRVTQDPGPAEFARGERYERMLQATVEFEAKQAVKKEDPAAVAAAQQAVLDALGAGKRYQLAMGGPEGIYTIEIQLENNILVKRETGKELEIDRYSTREEMMAFLRSYFLTAACKDTFPHKPPEVEIWKYVGYQLK
jgi:hypothetical protein